MCDEEGEDDCCACCPRVYQDRCFVITVLTQMAIGIVSYWMIIILPWKWYNSVFGLLHILALHTTYALMLTAYFKTMYTPAGRVPAGWAPPGITEEETEQAKMRARVGPSLPKKITDFYRHRWCRDCNAFKPPRAHHCRDLGHCVPRIDHYCPWVYNAVSFKNHKFFLQFLLYASVSLVYFLVMVIVRVVYEIRYTAPLLQRGQLLFTLQEIILVVLNMALTLPVTIGIVSLFVFQVSIVLENMTSYEEVTYKRYKRIAKRTRVQDWSWFFDFGWKQNISQLMGPSMLDWLIPQTPEHIRTGDGCSFKTHQFGQAPPPTKTVEGTEAPAVKRKPRVDTSSS
eukprot:TRINITY_DN11120_c0_g1_i1.p1 TRINITY_DN11120_c0_g1~~TRINITY_DN11120_c0_g1_i1.p1  ORF type:complete len:341 (+),score=33.77 TRINITY_DN11120_c0_g1_i1:56-1078(+)